MALVSQTEEKSAQPREAHVLRRLVGYLRPYKKYVLAGLLLTFLSAPLALAGPPLTKAAVDLFIAPDPSNPPTGYVLLLKRSAEQLGFGGQYRGMWFIALIFLCANLLSFAVQYTQGVVLQVMGQKVMYDLRKEIFTHLQRLPLSFHDRNPVGILMTRLTSDVDALNEMFTIGVVTILSNLIVMLYIVGWMLYVNWRLSLVTLAVLPLLILLTGWFRWSVRAANRAIRLHVANLNAFLQEHIGGISIVQLFNREETERNAFAVINDAHRRANIKALFFNSVFLPSVEIIGAVGIALTLWYGGRQVLGGAATLGTVIAFIQLARSFYEPISDISEKYNTLQSAMAASEKIFGVLDERASEKSADNGARNGRARGKIEFRNVWFAYAGEDWVLKDVSFIVRPGERVAFVGHTGAGKTTITNLLLRFYEIQRGQILLDDVDIRELEPLELRANFSIVLQDVALYSGDIASNIRLGNSSISDRQLRAAGQGVHADKFIDKLPEGYGTMLHERGAGLSSGQKQLISFARALAFDPRILILDEATSSVDTDTEALIRDAVGRLMQGRTSLAIAHRLSTIQAVDKIILLHKGQVREIGTHRELFNQRGLYWRLYQLQFGHELENVIEMEELV